MSDLAALAEPVDNRWPKTPGIKAALKRLEGDPALRARSHNHDD